MARLEKYSRQKVKYILRHVSRECPKPYGNSDIDSSRTALNVSLIEGRTGAAECYDYFKKRLSEVYCYHHKELKVLAQWVVTSPVDLKAEQETEFFEVTNDFLDSLYGSDNCVQAIVHYDEGVKNHLGEIVFGRPHLHYSFIPILPNKHHNKGARTASAGYSEKVCANELLNRQHLIKWHSEFQKFLNEHGVKCTVKNGATAGGNRTVAELKEQSKLEIENQFLKQRLAEMEQQLSRQHGWSQSKSWSKEATKSWEKEF